MDGREPAIEPRNAWRPAVAAREHCHALVQSYSIFGERRQADDRRPTPALRHGPSRELDEHFDFAEDGG